MTYIVHIHHDSFRVDDGTIDLVRAAIEAAVRLGGALVPIHHGERLTEVLVTPSSPVRIDEARVTHPTALAPHAWGSAVDLDDYELNAL
jgi:hypothetical protein